MNHTRRRSFYRNCSSARIQRAIPVKAPPPRVIHVRLAQRLRGRAWLARLLIDYDEHRLFPKSLTIELSPDCFLLSSHSPLPSLAESSLEYRGYKEIGSLLEEATSTTVVSVSGASKGVLGEHPLAAAVLVGLDMAGRSLGFQSNGSEGRSYGSIDTRVFNAHVSQVTRALLFCLFRLSARRARRGLVTLLTL